MELGLSAQFVQFGAAFFAQPSLAAGLRKRGSLLDVVGWDEGGKLLGVAMAGDLVPPLV